jgi:hypothetical protein
VPTVFIEPIDTSGWTEAQRRTSEMFWPVLRLYLAAQMRNLPACERFFDAQQAATKVGHIDISEWQTAVRIPVLNALGFAFDGQDADKQYSALYHLLGAATCLYMSYPAGRVDGPMISRAVDREARQLVDYLVTLGVTEDELPPLMELCKRL